MQDLKIIEAVLMKSSLKVGRLSWMVIALIHFSLGNLILPLTMALTAQAAATPDGPGIAVRLLVRATKLLHFPVVTLALYPREWFPGDWVYVPMAANSLIWAGGICWLIGQFRKGP
jgi:hypothetical protein